VSFHVSRTVTGICIGLSGSFVSAGPCMARFFNVCTLKASLLMAALADWTGLQQRAGNRTKGRWTGADADAAGRKAEGVTEQPIKGGGRIELRVGQQRARHSPAGQLRLNSDRIWSSPIERELALLDGPIADLGRSASLLSLRPVPSLLVVLSLALSRVRVAGKQGWPQVQTDSRNQERGRAERSKPLRKLSLSLTNGEVTSHTMH
jgi:hypothetical protein